MSFFRSRWVEVPDGLTEANGLAQSWAEISDHLRDSTRFARNLRRLLDGIEADLATR